jgi:periplasmic divalent cation tolerance protein
MLNCYSSTFAQEVLMDQDSSDAIVVLMTATNGEEATRLAQMLVGAHLAACVQILPEIQSIYRWQGRVQRQAEVLLIAKTTKSKLGEIDREVRALHSYETPEIVALPITAGSAPYLSWLTASLELEQAARS